MRDEKFYRVHSDSGLYATYFDYVNCRERVVEALGKFEEENGFKEGSLAVWGTTIYLKSASEDFLRYRDQLTKQSPDGGKNFKFRKTSKIGKLWAETAKELRFVSKPIVGFYNKASIAGRCSTRLFDYRGDLYCSIEADRIDMPGNIFTEMKDSEFYKIIELMEKEET